MYFKTTLNATKAMAMLTPKDDKNVKGGICESCVITVLPAANNKLFYYEKTHRSPIYKTISYSAHGLRGLLTNKKNIVAKMNIEAILIMNPGAASTFKNYY